MPKIKKKGTSGQAKNFITRTQAVRKLQISLPDFRRLCIFKGIFPREPRNKKKASKSSTPSTTFYYTKDVQYLLHEPLLNKFRDHKALAKKIARSLGRGEVGDAARLEKTGNPKLSLDHIIKERYPTFVDALRDLDDALSLLFLFANLPSTSTVPPKTIALCQRLCLEFEHYLITTHSLRKSFLSIKGIYYQATIHGQDVLWLVPYKFVQRVTGDVDFRIMGTFVEFYTTLLGFVNFRLYTAIGLVYPPKFDAKSDELGGELGAFTLEGQGIEDTQQIEAPTSGEIEGQMKGDQQISEEIQKQIDQIDIQEEQKGQAEAQLLQPMEEDNDKIDTFEATGPDADILPQPQSSIAETSTLFASFTFFLSRETPRQPLEFLLRAFGCKRIGWDAILGDGAFTNDEGDPSITHQVVDRPPLASLPEAQVTNTDQSAQIVRPGMRMPGRTYVQPQWVWDCINEVKLLRPDLYAPGTTLPPHLSPWVKPTKGAYDPTAPLAEQEREGEAEEAEMHDLGDEEQAGEGEATATSLRPNPTAADLEGEEEEEVEEDDHGMTVADSDSDASDSDTAPKAFTGFSSGNSSNSDDDNISDTESLDPTLEHQRELEAEALGLPPSSSSNPTLKGILKPSSSAPDGTKDKSAKKGNDRNEDGDVDVAAARKRSALKKKRREEEEELERRKGMMGRRQRKVLEKMLYSNARKEEEAEGLRRKRRRIEGGR